MMTLLHRIVECGLLQFGYFAHNSIAEPVQFHFDMLGSYPDVLEMIASELHGRLSAADRLLSVADAVPLGTALALKTGIPLVYSHGGANESVTDFVGAYDIGHPAILVTNVAGSTQYTRLLASARRVGLEVQGIAAIMDLGGESPLPVVSLLKLADILYPLVEMGVLPVGQVDVVKTWLAGK